MINRRRAILLELRREMLVLQARQDRQRLAAQARVLLQPLSTVDTAFSLWQQVRTRPWLLALPLAAVLMLRRAGWLKRSSQLATLWRIGRQVHEWWSRTRAS